MNDSFDKRDRLRDIWKMFREIEAEKWDLEIEEDIESGRLDEIADRAISEYKNGKLKEL